MSNTIKLTDQARTFEVIAWVAVVVLSVQFLALLKLLSLIGPGMALLSQGDWRGFFEAGAPVFRRLVGLWPALIYLGGLLSAAAFSAGSPKASCSRRPIPRTLRRSALRCFSGP